MFKMFGTFYISLTTLRGREPLHENNVLSMNSWIKKFRDG